MNQGSLNETMAQPVAISRPQPRIEDFAELELLRLALNQVDYGLVVVDADTGLVQFANALGSDALEAAQAGAAGAQCDTGLCLHNGRIAARQPIHADLLRHALERTKAGLRGLLSLGATGQACSVAVVPLSGGPGKAGARDATSAPAAGAAPNHALLVFAKQQPCDDSTMALFARDRGLTSAEGQVLAQVCRGLRPAEIADQHGVQISTVRTQLRSIRMKTCSETIRELVQKVSVLPPMARHLSTRGAVPA